MAIFFEIGGESRDDCIQMLQIGGPDGQPDHFRSLSARSSRLGRCVIARQRVTPLPDQVIQHEADWRMEI